MSGQPLRDAVADFAERQGYADYLFIGIMVDGGSIDQWEIGAGVGLQTSNTERIDRIIGALERVKMDIHIMSKEGKNGEN